MVTTSIADVVFGRPAAGRGNVSGGFVVNRSGQLSACPSRDGLCESGRCRRGVGENDGIGIELGTGLGEFDWVGVVIAFDIGFADSERLIPAPGTIRCPVNAVMDKALARTSGVESIYATSQYTVFNK